MLQGTGSDVGKSVLVAGLCRIAARKNLKVSPFKPQNMSNNAAIADDGGEIGRAQVLQARAAGVQPTVDMNPILLKPETDNGSQIIIHGKKWGNIQAQDFKHFKNNLFENILHSFEILKNKNDLIIVEGAGSPAEVNLRAGDIANMGFATRANVPVVLVGDIERGGVIASLVGTKTVMSIRDAAQIKGFIINKFRGDIALFADGLSEIERLTGWNSYGIVPWFSEVNLLPAEDSVGLERFTAHNKKGFKIAVPMIPRIANFDDLDPFRMEPDVNLIMVPPGKAIEGDVDLILLPGSKSTISDLRFLRSQGWEIDIIAHVRRGGRVWGICGGYQMLGNSIEDPYGIEGKPTKVKGLGLLNVNTVLNKEKYIGNVKGHDILHGKAISGYEIHLGWTEGPDCSRPLLELACSGESKSRLDGAQSIDGCVVGSYVHGLFNADDFRRAMLKSMGVSLTNSLMFEKQIEAALDSLADHLALYLDLDDLFGLAR